MTSANIRKAQAKDWPAIERLLQGAGLPVDDLDESGLEHFLVALDTVATPPSVNGAIGLQAFGSAGLLRSLVVDPGSRAAGIGRQLVQALEEQALAAGLTELWLLTVDAEVFFWKLDYRIVDRGKAPASIQGTREFTSLCPGSAHLMHKPL
ncbi:MAG TPA: arsenic resistance N-acetyltransferase ArsN2 [Woeseiaceae bacterium]|nr:arsenic resistance N-acetyltransferase ArsN2 [Woeseiaceae bacterium]